MAETIKIITSEIALTTANTVSLASVVRIHNNSGGAALLTRANTGGTVGTCTVANGTTEYFLKLPTDTLASNVAVRACAVAFS
jgi:hypothetical protein